MKILHICLSCFYIDNYIYQENILPIYNLKDGHKVKIIASTQTFLENKKIGYVNSGNYRTKEGIEVVRLKYYGLFSPIIMSKIKKYKGLKKEIEEYEPDIIYYHGCGGISLLEVCNYVKKKKITLYVDNHADFNNSAKNSLSKIFLHKIFNRIIMKISLKYINKIFYVSEECKQFLIELYNIPKDKLEFYPIGGIILSEEERKEKREKKRKELKLNDEILFVHSGKLDKQKKTEELITAFSNVKEPKFKLLIIGSIDKSIEKEVIEKIAKDLRIKYLGWIESEELVDYLHASDVYLQPGSQSATMQSAMCSGAALLLYPHVSYNEFLKGNGKFASSIKEMEDFFKEIKKNPNVIEEMKKKSIERSYEILDYRKLARRIYER